MCVIVHIVSYKDYDYFITFMKGVFSVSALKHYGKELLSVFVVYKRLSVRGKYKFRVETGHEGVFSSLYTYTAFFR